MAVGAFVGIAIWAFALAPMESASAMGATTGGPSGGTTGSPTPHYDVTWPTTVGSSRSTAVSEGTEYFRTWSTTGDSNDPNKNSETIDSGGMETDPPSAGLGRAQCPKPTGTNKLIAKFTWNDENTGQDPPPAVLVFEESTASATGVTRNVNCAISGANVTDVMPTKSCSGSRYTTVPDPGLTFFLELSPSASAETLEVTEDYPMHANATVSYRVTPYPMRINLSGILANQTTNRILIGQELTASVDLGGFSPGANPIWYTWQVSGGDPFESYVATQTSSTYSGWLWASSHNQSVDFFFAEGPDASVVSCTVTVPALGISVDLEVDVGVEVPAVQSVHAVIGTFQYIPNATSPVMFRLYGAQIPNVSTMYGIIEVVWVTTPQDFWQGSAKGQYGWTQLFDDDSKQNVNGGGWTAFADPPTSGGVWLDRSHPYPNAGYFVAGGQFSTPISDSFQPFYRDSPGFGTQQAPLHTSVPALGYQSYGLQFDADFDLYVMYDPPNAPNADTAEVPLRRRDWTGWGQFVWTSPSTWGTPTDNSSLGTTTNYPPHPIWTQRWI